MACGLSRSELSSFNVAFDEKQRCQAIRPGGGGVCNSLLTEHIRDTSASPQTKQQTKEETNDVTNPDADSGLHTTSFCSRLGKRAVQAAQVIFVTYMAFTFALALFVSDMTFEVDTSNVSNLMLNSDADALQFWYRGGVIGLSTITYSDDAVAETFLYSSRTLYEYDCDFTGVTPPTIDSDCKTPLDDLKNAWNTLVVSSCFCGALCIIAWLLSIPRGVYPCMHSTKVYQSAVRENKPILMWFLKPIGLTYLLTAFYSVVVGVEIVAALMYTNQMPKEDRFYMLALHYLNQDPSLCSVENPCQFDFGNVYNDYQDISFIIASIVCAAFSIVFVIMSHNLKLQSIVWTCFCCASGRREGAGSVPSLSMANIISSDTKQGVSVGSSAMYIPSSTASLGSSCLDEEGGGDFYSASTPVASAVFTADQEQQEKSVEV